MIKKLKALFMLFQKGKVVANPGKWKTGQMESSAVVASIWAIIHVAEAWGYAVPVGSETVDAVAIGLLAGINWVFTVITTDKIGLPPKSQLNKPG
jgi:hypothetical protein